MSSRENERTKERERERFFPFASFSFFPCLLKFKPKKLVLFFFPFLLLQNLSLCFLIAVNASASLASTETPSSCLIRGSKGLRKGFVRFSSPSKEGTVANPAALSASISAVLCRSSAFFESRLEAHRALDWVYS